MKQVLIRGGGVAVEDVPAPQRVAALDPRPRRALVRLGRDRAVERAHVRAAALQAGAEAAAPREAGARDREERGLRAHVQARARDARRRPADRLLGRRRRRRRSATRSSGFRAGDRVACAGAGIANHAELIDVPVNLAVRIPDGLDTGRRLDGDARRDRAPGRAPRPADARRDGRGHRPRHPRPARRAAPAGERRRVIGSDLDPTADREGARARAWRTGSARARTSRAASTS